MLFDPHVRISKIILVGLGGTGAQIARILARTTYNMRQNHLHTPDILFIDPDCVEPKNIGRQLFSAGDVGQQKAVVTMRRFNQALGLNIIASTESFKKSYVDGWGTLLIGAVDNEVARREMFESKSAIYIDCGNHHTSGQVVIGNTNDISKVKADNDGVYHYLPTAPVIFPTLLEPEPPAKEEVSCADLVAREEQHLLVNDQMAVIAGTYIYKLLYRQPITSCMTFVDLQSLAMRSIPVDQIHGYIQTA